MIWNNLSLPWRCCMEEAWEAYCAGSLPIGAAITDAGGKIVARGRNRIFETAADGKLIYGHMLAHAEINALLALDYVAVDAYSYVLYTTTEPCPLCVGAIRMSRVRAVHYAARDSAAGSSDLFAANSYMRRAAISVVGPQDAVLEAIIAGLQVELRLREADPKTAWLLDNWAETVPRGVALGNTLFRSGALRRLVEQVASAAQMVDHLGALLVMRSRGIMSLRILS